MCKSSMLIEVAREAEIVSDAGRRGTSDGGYQPWRDVVPTLSCKLVSPS